MRTKEKTKDTEKIVLVFGNPKLEEDNLALKVSKELKLEGFTFIECASADSLLYFVDKDFIILDVVKGAKKTMLIDDVERLKQHKIVSLHDFDLGYFLKLLDKLGKLKNTKIIGIPQQGNIEEIREDVVKILKKIE
ncbi:MAG: hypothetical protein V1659_03400 [Candidatus Woesearchaeota archaeon]